jgi:hypothetical protein
MLIVEVATERGSDGKRGQGGGEKQAEGRSGRDGDSVVRVPLGAGGGGSGGWWDSGRGEEGALLSATHLVCLFSCAREGQKDPEWDPRCAMVDVPSRKWLVMVGGVVGRSSERSGRSALFL